MVEDLIPEMVTIRDASARTGLSYDAIRKLCLTGQIVYFRAGKKFFVNFGKLCDFLNGNGGLINE